ncbi:hypothetical protein CPB86DRAFT_842861 [Serendipita vermifera]|nr:hypothetical protein CPB86DRAFT_842861 [Serendipita vermifera]
MKVSRKYALPSVEAPSPQISWSGFSKSHAVMKNTTQKFLAYLPHSGFHNQRIELENALLLSTLLNRTLVLPLARLGTHPLPYKEFDKLYNRYNVSGKSWLAHCLHSDTSANSTVKECRKYERYTHISWRDITNIDLLMDSGIETIERWEFNSSWFKDTLGIMKEDTYWLKDSSAYEFQFCESNDEQSSHGKFEHRIKLHDLSLASESFSLLHVGSLFGTSRLRLATHKSRELRRRIQSSMSIGNHFLLNLAGQIVSEIGGTDTFFSIHLRLGDGLFAEYSNQTAHRIWGALLHHSYGLSRQETVRLEASESQVDASPIDLPPPFSVPLQYSPYVHQLGCSKLRPERSNSLSTPLFIATDARNPRLHPALSLFRSTFPCVWFISDFPHILGKMKEIVNPLDKTPMATFLAPFIDALVAARGASFIGTPESTFSRYIEEVLWPQVHGMNDIH